MSQLVRMMILSALAAGLAGACSGDDDEPTPIDAARADAAAFDASVADAAAPDAAVRPSRFAYASNADSNDVTVVDTKLGTTATIDCTALSVTCTEPRNPAISPDGALVAVPFRHTDNVLLLDADTQKLVAEITDTSFDEPYAAAFTADGAELWIANKKGGGSTTGSVSVIDVAKRAVIAVIDDSALSSPEGLVLTATHAYVANRSDGTVTVIAVATRAVVTTISVGGDPRFTVATPDGAYVYASTDGASVAKIDTTTHKVVKTITVAGSSRNMAIAPDGATVYVALLNDSMAAIDVAGDTATTITFAGASELYAVTILHDGSLGLVTDDSADKVHTFDPASNTVTADTTFTAGSTPRGITSY